MTLFCNGILKYSIPSYTNARRCFRRPCISPQHECFLDCLRGHRTIPLTRIHMIRRKKIDIAIDAGIYLGVNHPHATYYRKPRFDLRCPCHSYSDLNVQHFTGNARFNLGPPISVRLSADTCQLYNMLPAQNTPACPRAMVFTRRHGPYTKSIRETLDRVYQANL